MLENGLNQFLNQVMLLKSGVEIEIELRDETKSWIKSQENLRVLDILRMVEICQKFETNLRHMKYPQLNLDSLLVKLLALESTVTISEIMSGKVENIPPNPFPEIHKIQKPQPVKEAKNEELKEVETKVTSQKPEPIIEKVSEPKENLIPEVEKKIDEKVESKLDLNFFTRNWNDFLDQVEAEHPKYLTYLSDINLKSYENGNLHILIDVEDEFNAKGIKKNQKDLEKLLKEYSGDNVKLSLEITNNTLKPTVEKKTNSAMGKSKGHPLFETIMETFDGEIIRS